MTVAAPRTTRRDRRQPRGPGTTINLSIVSAHLYWPRALRSQASGNTGFEVACYAMWSGTLLLLPLLPNAIRGLEDAPPSAIASAVYLGLPPSALGFATWSYAVARLPAAQSTAALYLVPPVAVIVAFLWLGERPSPLKLLGGAIGIVVVILGRG